MQIALATPNRSVRPPPPPRRSFLPRRHFLKFVNERARDGEPTVLLAITVRLIGWVELMEAMLDDPDCEGRTCDLDDGRLVVALPLCDVAELEALVARVGASAMECLGFNHEFHYVASAVVVRPEDDVAAAFEEATRTVEEACQRRNEGDWPRVEWVTRRGFASKQAADARSVAALH